MDNLSRLFYLQYFEKKLEVDKNKEFYIIPIIIAIASIIPNTILFITLGFNTFTIILSILIPTLMITPVILVVLEKNEVWYRIVKDEGSKPAIDKTAREETYDIIIDQENIPSINTVIYIMFLTLTSCSLILLGYVLSLTLAGKELEQSQHFTIPTIISFLILPSILLLHYRSSNSGVMFDDNVIHKILLNRSVDHINIGNIQNIKYEGNMLEIDYNVNMDITTGTRQSEYEPYKIQGGHYIPQEKSKMTFKVDEETAEKIQKEIRKRMTLYKL